MKCLHPLELPIIADGKKTKSYHLVPCGKCVACLKQRQEDWIFRLQYEHKLANACVFITLTYDDEHVPVTEYGYTTLVMSDLQKYFKRLRKRFAPKELKFFACGEYGTHTVRCHYHALVFYYGNKDIDLSEMVQKDWHDGFVQVGTVTDGSIAYVTKYTLKSCKFPEHSQKPFIIMSRNPAIGAGYLSDQQSVYHSDHLYYVQPGGYKKRLPRYYADQIGGVTVKSGSDLMEQVFFKKNPGATMEDFYKWKQIRIENHEWVVSHRLEKEKL